MFVHAEKIQFDQGAAGRLVLSRSKALNALTVEMFEELHKALESWENDPEIKLVILESESDRAFCAGGDVKSVVMGSRDETSGFAQKFFLAEYGLDYYLHCYPKPILCWAHGLTMGGGIGLMNGCSHRVATETSVFAMPEISIGFFPDVGGGYFLNQLAPGVGLFLGMTGARLHSGDAVALGLADYLIKNVDRESILETLKIQEWSKQDAENFAKLTKVLDPFRLHEIQSELALPLTQIGKELAALTSFEQVDHYLQEGDLGLPHLEEARRAYLKGSAFVARVIFEHIRRCQGKSLAQVFALEWALAIRFSQEFEFQEGVRALLIDKDKAPQWRVKQSEEIVDLEVEKILSPVEDNLLAPQLKKCQPRG